MNLEWAIVTRGALAIAAINQKPILAHTEAPAQRRSLTKRNGNTGFSTSMLLIRLVLVPKPLRHAAARSVLSQARAHGESDR